MANPSDNIFQPADYVRRVFKDADDDLEAITEIQQENRVKIPSVHPALSFLGLHEVPRAQVHLSLFQRLRNQLEQRLEEMEERGLRKLLEKSFGYVSVPELRPVVMSIVEAMPPPVDESFLLEIAEKEELYSVCPTSVKQQIWQINPGVFGEAVSPLLDQYVAYKEGLLFETIDPNNLPSAFFSIQPKTRRQNAVLQKLVQLLGSSVPLYNTLCQFLRTLYLRTHVSHYCTLRADLIMLLHEQDNVIMDSDRCHKFAWCLDASIRANSVDEKKLKELYNFLDTIEGGDEVLEDVSMLLRDPYSLHIISRTVLQNLHKLIGEQKLPRESKTMESLLRLLSIGLKSLTYLDKKAYTGDPLESEVVIEFLPELTALMMEPSLRSARAKLKQDHTPLQPTKKFTSLMASSQEAMVLLCTYCLHLVDKKDFKTLALVLPTVAKSCINSEKDIMPDGFLHSMAVMLLPHVAALREPQMIAIMKEFWLPCSQHSETALLHCCRFLWVCHDKIKPGYILDDLLQNMCPSEQMSDVSNQQYNLLLEHIQSNSPSHQP